MGDTRSGIPTVSPVTALTVAARPGDVPAQARPSGLPRLSHSTGLLDEIIVSVAPVTLGEGRPLFPRRCALRTLEVAHNGAFACVRYAVVGARTDRW